MANSLLAVAPLVPILVGIGALILGGVAGFWLTMVLHVKKAGKSKTAALKILDDAYAQAKIIVKEATLEAKEETQKLRTEQEKEFKERKSELQRAEDRMLQKEELLTKKEFSIDSKTEALEKSKQDLTQKHEEIDKALAKQKELNNNLIVELEKISGLKKEEAKQIIIQSLEEDAKKQAAKTIREIENKTKDDSMKIAQNIVASAIQKCATDVTSETTVSAVVIPNDEMKGRIIGREGRNIKALESATGVDLIIDDTPETITLSCFDPIRREIARITLEKLILDGRIHPTRIEEIVEKVSKDVETTIKQAGENASEEAEVYGIHPELIKVLGRLKFRTSYGQNALKHSLETAFIAGLLASEIGADIKIAKRGGLLHDIGKALDHEVEGTHVSIGVELAKKYKENPAVIHCIEAHHFNVEFNSVEAVLVQVADAISSSRPGARRESLDNYVKRLEQLEEISMSFKGVEKAFAVQAGREIRIIVKPTEVSDESVVFLANDIAKRIEDEMQYPGQIKVNVIRESRHQAIAK